MVVHGPLQDNVSYDADLGPVILSDWYHEDYYTIVQNVESPILVSYRTLVAPCPFLFTDRRETF